LVFSRWIFQFSILKSDQVGSSPTLRRDLPSHEISILFGVSLMRLSRNYSAVKLHSVMVIHLIK
jgi:hypothetical protein